MNNIFRNLVKRDPKLFEIIQKEYNRQRNGIELIASENFTSPSVLECLGSILTNKYSEGLPGRRYYGGNEFIDEIENCCRDRALETFNLKQEEWGVNVQPYSGSIANIACYLGFLKLHDRIMGLDLPSGGHLSHGFYIGEKKINHTSLLFESLPYQIKDDGFINYEELEDLALRFRPKLIICGGSAYPRDFDYKRFRMICDKIGSYLLCDMAHISGFIATNLMKSPFEYCDFVTTTTHKTLRGPRAGMIFFRKQYEKQINDSVFPGTQGGPHQNKIAAVATQLLEVQTPEFKDYMTRILDNSRVLASELKKYGYDISTDGTDNHIVLVNLRNKGITGSKIETICEHVNISINKNAVFGDVSPLSPGGIRLGTSAMTTRGFTTDDIKKLANILHGLIEFSLEIQEKYGKKIIDFKKALDEPDIKEKLQSVKFGIELWVSSYYFPDLCSQ
jgi:glycine hydroxymethyltransferase